MSHQRPFQPLALPTLVALLAANARGHFGVRSEVVLEPTPLEPFFWSEFPWEPVFFAMRACCLGVEEESDVHLICALDQHFALYMFALAELRFCFCCLAVLPHV